MEWEMTMRAGSIDYLKCHLGDYEALAASVYEYDVMTFPFYICAHALYMSPVDVIPLFIE